jgi:hypothetical protein
VFAPPDQNAAARRVPVPLARGVRWRHGRAPLVQRGPRLAHSPRPAPVDQHPDAVVGSRVVVAPAHLHVRPFRHHPPPVLGPVPASANVLGPILGPESLVMMPNADLDDSGCRRSIPPPRGCRPSATRRPQPTAERPRFRHGRGGARPRICPAPARGPPRSQPVADGDAEPNTRHLGRQHRDHPPAAYRGELLPYSVACPRPWRREQGPIQERLMP